MFQRPSEVWTRLTEGSVKLMVENSICRRQREAKRKVAVQIGRAGRTAEARDEMRQAVTLLPDNGEAWLDLCLLSLDLGDRASAATALDRARTHGADAEREFERHLKQYGCFLHVERRVFVRAPTWARSAPNSTGAAPPVPSLRTRHRAAGAVGSSRSPPSDPCRSTPTSSAAPRSAEIGST